MLSLIWEGGPDYNHERWKKSGKAWFKVEKYGSLLFGDYLYVKKHFLLQFQHPMPFPPSGFGFFDSRSKI